MKNLSQHMVSHYDAWDNYLTLYGCNFIRMVTPSSTFYYRRTVSNNARACKMRDASCQSTALYCSSLLTISKYFKYFACDDMWVIQIYSSAHARCKYELGFACTRVSLLGRYPPIAATNNYYMFQPYLYIVYSYMYLYIQLYTCAYMIMNANVI